jgi:hypothetical protein
VENDTAAYVAVVAQRIGVGPDDTIDLHRHDHLRPLVEAIIHHECAGLSYPAGVIDRALTLAGVPPAAPVTLREVATVTGTGRGAVLVGAAGIATAVAQAAQAAPAIQALGTLAPAVAIAVIAAAVVGVLAWRLRRPA